MKKNLNYTYNYIKEEVKRLQHITRFEVRSVILNGIYRAAYEYVRDGGKKDLESILAKTVMKQKKEEDQGSKKYFCGACDARFTAVPCKISGAVECPKCGCYCCYEDTPEGSNQALKDLTAYENELMWWEDEHDD